MTLFIKTNICSDESYLLTCASQTARIDEFSKEASFDIPQIGSYTVTITQNKEKHLPIWFSVLLFILTAPLQGLFHILLLNTDTNWENDVRAKRLCAKFDVLITEDTTIRLKAGYSKASSGFYDAVISASPEVNIAYQNTVDSLDFSRQYLRFGRKLLSAYSVFLILFGFLLFKVANNMLGHIIIGGVMAAMTAVVAFVLLWNFKKMKKIRRSFLEYINGQNSQMENKYE